MANLKESITEAIDANLERMYKKALLEKNYAPYWDSIFGGYYTPASQLNQGLQSYTANTTITYPNGDTEPIPNREMASEYSTALSWRDAQLAQSFIKVGDVTYVRDDLRPQDGWRLVGGGGGGSTSPVAASPPAKPVERTIEDDIDTAIQAMRAKS